jgi:hypothetical protein
VLYGLILHVLFGGPVEKDINNVFVRRVLTCLNETKTKDEVVRRYDQLYPPTKFERIIGRLRRDEAIEDISTALTFLLQEEYIKTEVFSYTDRALRVPIIRYSRTAKGTQEISKTRKNLK